MDIQLAPSVLSADWYHLAEEVKSVRGCDALHVDVMDGQFVPNITFGPKMVRTLAASGMPLDVHLMLADPDRFLEEFVQAGATWLTVQAEACLHLHRTLARIRDLGCRVGVSLNPATPLQVLEHVWGMVDLVLIMTVNPGFGGQQFIDAMLPKIEAARARCDACPSPPVLEVDGGITPHTAPAVVQAGGQMLVAGSAVFGAPDRAAAMEAIRASVASL